MDKDTANRIYDILVSIGGAIEMYRDSFVYSHVPPNSCNEWRFGGKLGFGGKYRSQRNTVDCYSEDETDERRELMKKIDEALELIQPSDKPSNITKLQANLTTQISFLEEMKSTIDEERCSHVVVQIEFQKKHNRNYYLLYNRISEEQIFSGSRSEIVKFTTTDHQRSKHNIESVYWRCS